MSFHGHTAGNPHYCQHSSKAYFIWSCVFCALYIERKLLILPRFSEWKLTHRKFEYLVQVYT